MNEEQIARLKVMASGFAKAVADADSKAGELGVINNAGIGPQFDVLANLTADILRLSDEIEAASAGTMSRTALPEIVEMKSPVSVNGALRTKEWISNVATEVISLIGSKGVTVETALFILDKSKDAVNKCTVLQAEYTP